MMLVNMSLHVYIEANTREAVSTLMATLSLHGEFYTNIAMSHSSLVSINELIKLCSNTKNNSITCVSNVIAALCNLGKAWKLKSYNLSRVNPPNIYSVERRGYT